MFKNVLLILSAAFLISCSQADPGLTIKEISGTLSKTDSSFSSTSSSWTVDVDAGTKSNVSLRVRSSSTSNWLEPKDWSFNENTKKANIITPTALIVSTVLVPVDLDGFEFEFTVIE